MAPSRTVSAVQSVPFAYRLILLNIEPLFAALGAVMACVKPSMYTDTMTRGALPFAPETSFIYTQTAGGWLYFAFVEAIVLRFYDDLRLWRLLCIGMLLSDTLYCVGTIQAVGGLANWATLADWTDEDWVTFFSTLPMVIVRVLIVLGIGIKPTKTPMDAAKTK